MERRAFFAAMRHLLIMFCLLSPLVGIGQEVTQVNRSSHLWMDLGVRGKLAKNLRGVGEMGYRTGDELRRGQQFFLNGELRYKLHKYIDVGFEQRVSFRSGQKNRHRTGLMWQAGGRIGRTTLQYRMTYQHIWREFGAVRDVLRHRFGVEYDVRGWQFDPEASVEFFTAYTPGLAEYDAVRYKLGTSWSPAKGHRFSFKFVHDREQNRRRPDYRWIFAFGYMLDLGKV